MMGASALFFILICTILGTKTQVRHHDESSVEINHINGSLHAAAPAPLLWTGVGEAKQLCQGEHYFDYHIDEHAKQV